MRLYSIVNVPLGAQVAPIGTIPKSEPFTAIGVGLGVGSLLAGAYSSYKNLQAQADTNETNYKIWQEQLAAQKENWQREQANFLKQREWQLEDRAYNTPASLKARYQAAGINPYLAMYGGAGELGAANETSPNSPSFSSPAQPTPMQSLDYSGFGVAAQNAANMFLMASRNQSDIAASKQHINNETIQTLGNLKKIGVDTKYTRALTRSVIQDIKFNNQSWSGKLKGIELANDAIEAELEYKKATTEYQQLLNKFAPQEQKKILVKLDKEIDEISSKIRSNDAQSAYNAALEALSNAQKDGVDIDNVTKQEMAADIVAAKSAEADRLEVLAQKEGKYLEDGDVFGRLVPRTYDLKTGNKTNYINLSRGGYGHRGRLVKGSDGRYYFSGRQFSNRSSQGGIR